MRASEKGDGFIMGRTEDTHLYRETHQQPEVLARLLGVEAGTARALAGEIKPNTCWVPPTGWSRNWPRQASLLSTGSIL